MQCPYLKRLDCDVNSFADRSLDFIYVCYHIHTFQMKYFFVYYNRWYISRNLFTNFLLDYISLVGPILDSLDKSTISCSFKVFYFDPNLAWINSDFDSFEQITL